MRAERALEAVARLNTRAITALAYLREMVETPNAAKALRHVRRCLEELHTEPLQILDHVTAPRTRAVQPRRVRVATSS